MAIERVGAKAVIVSLHPLPSLSDVEVLWRSLASATTHSFFVSWPWIQSWLACLPASVKPQLMLVSDCDRVVAAGLMVRRTLRRHHVVPVQTWVLNATGDPGLDQIFIEHNGLLALPEYSVSAPQAWAEAFMRVHDDWDEIQLRGVLPSSLEVWEHPAIRLRESSVMTGRFIDLKELRSAHASIVEKFAKKKRAAIRYTRRSLEKRGPIRVEVAQSSEQAFDFLKELKVLHQLRWQGRFGRGAFDYPFFELFHSHLIHEHFKEGVIQLLRVCAGDQTVGVLYNFVHQGVVAVYQTGFNYSLIESANKESPGLLTHALAIDFNMAQGHDRYDLLAGDSEYKRTLADKSEQLWWGRVQRQRLKFRAEDGLKRVLKVLVRRNRVA